MSRRPSVLSFELQDGDVDLDVMTRHLSGISLGVNPTPTRSVRQPGQPIAAKNPIRACIGDLDPMVAIEMPNDANRPQMVDTA